MQDHDTSHEQEIPHTRIKSRKKKIWKNLFYGAVITLIIALLLVETSRILGISSSSSSPSPTPTSTSPNPIIQNEPPAKEVEKEKEKEVEEKKPAVIVFEPLPLKQSLDRPSKQCFKVNIDQSNSMKHLISSLKYYVEERKYEVVTAMHLGDASCVMAIQLPNGKAHIMFNPSIGGISAQNLVHRNEYSTDCPDVKRTLIRSDIVTVNYMTETGEEMFLSVFKKKEAWSVQNGYLYLLGYSICHELDHEWADQGVTTLSSILGSSN